VKTKPNNLNVTDFLESIEDNQKKLDSYELLKMLEQSTGATAKMWGDTIIGVGEYHYKYESGREGDWFKVGFSPRKQAITLYLTYDLEQEAELLKALGKHKIGKACLYIKRLADVDKEILQKLIDKTAKSYD